MLENLYQLVARVVDFLPSNAGSTLIVGKSLIAKVDLTLILILGILCKNQLFKLKMVK